MRLNLVRDRGMTVRWSAGVNQQLVHVGALMLVTHPHVDGRGDVEVRALRVESRANWDAAILPVHLNLTVVNLRELKPNGYRLPLRRDVNNRREGLELQQNLCQQFIVLPSIEKLHQDVIDLRDDAPRISRSW
ncbi:hypothetical protein D3C85_1350150 [compost metagenome]